MGLLRDAPDIERTMRTGYPYPWADPAPEIECDNCGESLAPTDMMFQIDGLWCCQSCLEEHIKTLLNDDPEKIAEALGITYKNAGASDAEF